MKGSEKINKVLAEVGMKPSEFAKIIGLKAAQNIYDIQKDKVDISRSVALKIVQVFPTFNISWLLTGEGEMLKKTEDKPESNADMSTAIPVVVGDGTIPLLPISAQGGTLNDFITSVMKRDCERIISPINGADFAITVPGDSMAPEYPSGSHVIIKKINERAFIDWGRTYVLDTCNGVVIKRLMPADNGDASKVKCVSINPAYPPFEVSLQDVYGIYRVMLYMAIK